MILLPLLYYGRNHMSENHADTSVEFDTEIRLERVNTDKTRLDIGSVTAYHVLLRAVRSSPPGMENHFRAGEESDEPDLRSRS